MPFKLTKNMKNDIIGNMWQRAINMEFIIKRMHSEEELKERILDISREDLERSIAKGQAIIRNGRISRIKKSIQE